MRVPGLPRFLGDLRAAHAAAVDLTEPNQEAGALLARALSSRSRVRTGRLAASWSSTGHGATSSAPYAVPVQAAYPFVGGAIEAAEKPLTPLYDQHLDKALGHVHGHY